MHRITLLLLFTLLLPDLYIYFAYIVRRTQNTLLRLSYWIPTLLLAILYAYYMYLMGDNAMSHHALGIGRLAIALMLFATPKTLFMLCSWIGMLIHAFVRRCPTRPFTLLGVGFALVSFGCIAYGSFVGITRFEVKEVTCYSPRLPDGFDGYRIVQLSDIHAGSWQGRPQVIQKLVTLANDQKADLIVFTGDLVNQRSRELDDFTSILSQLHAPDGVYSILGNHDYGTYYHWKSPEEEKANLDHLLRQQASMGWTMLNNAHAILRHQGDSIALIGVENDGEPPFSQFADLHKAAKGTNGMFKILLSHNPTHWRREVLPDSDIDLTLSGHTHAMQGIFFGHSLAALKYPEWAGMYTEGERSLYVNIGIGYVGLPFRFGAWPEITVITLKKGIGEK